jgi:uncharacterized membrane protein YhhN
MKIRARALYAILALAFIATLPYSPYEGSFALKVFPILLLFGAVVASAPFRGKWLLVAAVVFSGAGDVILDLTFQGNFIAGLVSFLTAHIFYVALFLKGAAVRRNMILPTVLAVAFPAAMAAFLWPHLGQMQLPVAVYIGVISSMLVTSLHRSRLNFTVIAGAIAFVISDSVLALNKFYSPFPWARYAIMATYYLAQYLIVTGVLQEQAD